MKKLLVLLSFCGVLRANAQKTPVLNIDTIFSENIGTVEFYANSGLRGGNLPVAELSSGEGFTLLFDDFEGDFKNLLYTVDQCDRDWKPTRLDKLEYLEGLQEDRITIFKNSQATNTKFISYALSIPNQTMRWNKSGNYILRVFMDNNEKTPILTRRFIVVEPQVGILPEFIPAMSGKFNSHHELNFRLSLKNFKVQNPMNEIRTTVVQNGRWDNARLSVAPQFQLGEELAYTYRDTFMFPAGKEWRYVDLRSTRFRSERVEKIVNGQETWEMILRPDLDRSREPYLIYPDLNGGFFIENRDFNNGNQTAFNVTQVLTTLTGQPILTPLDRDFQAARADYVNAHFAFFKKEPLEDYDIYIWGRLTDWKLDERFKLEYDDRDRLYEATVELKQGFYNYIYVAVPINTRKIDFSMLEGDWYGAENEYQFIVYYRPFGSRYDRVVGFQKFNSSPSRR